jgi:hypothetical protein
MTKSITFKEQQLKDRLHYQAENLADKLFYRKLKLTPGTPEAERLKQLLERADHRAERRFLASLLPPKVLH